MQYIQKLVFLVLVLSFLRMQAQQDFNIQLVGHVQYPDSEFSDVWGYVDGTGHEYAIIGATDGTLIYDLSDPTHPEERQFIPGASSIWRDFKSYGNYIYGIADQGKDGLLIIDMNRAPEEITWTFWNDSITVKDNEGNPIRKGTLDHCHNLYIDENGFLYFADCANVHRGNLILDVGKEPGIPVFVNVFNEVLSHDIIVRHDTAYSSDIYAGQFSVWDVRDKMHPIKLATQPTSSEFTHNAWLSDDGQFLFTTDELAEAYVGAYDVSDPNDIRFLDKYRPVNAATKQVIPHNVHYKDGFLITSYYTDGLKIIDAHRPDLLVEVGSFDTYPGEDGGYHGDWGAYPWLPSGLVLVSDIERGLYVFRPEYRRAYYVTGHVTDAATGDFLQDVRITVAGDRLDPFRTDATGQYQLGFVEGDTLHIEYYLPGYETVERTLIAEAGTTLLENIALQAKSLVSYQVQVLEAGSLGSLENAIVRWEDREYIREDLTGKNGIIQVQLPVGGYEMVIGKWGYITQHIPLELANLNEPFVVTLQPGIADDYSLDLGWEVSGTATRGHWVREVPVGTFFGGESLNPGMDSDDPGKECYLTGNGIGPVGAFDLDEGTTRLRSPAFSIQPGQSPLLGLKLWYRVESGTPDNDTLRVFLEDSQGELILLDAFVQTWPGWQSFSYDLSGLEDGVYRCVIEANDLPGQGLGNLVEAAVDDFKVQHAAVSSIPESWLATLTWDFYPNPVGDLMHVRYRLDHVDGPVMLQLFNTQGQVVLEQTIGSQEEVKIPEYLPDGVYVAVLLGPGFTSAARKLVIQH